MLCKKDLVFILVDNFSYMFNNCNNLNTDILYINTKNSKTFEGIFYYDENINEIDISN